MNTLAPAIETDSKPAIHAPLQATVVCLGLGGVLLAAGCSLGYLQINHGAWIVAVLACSIGLFAAALVLQVKPLKASPALPLALDTVAPSLPRSPPNIELGANTLVQPAAPRPVTPSAPAAPPESVAPACSINERKSFAAVPQDVATLMQAPLSDLLLAAVCKDPLGARRIFAQVTMQADSSGSPEAMQTIAKVSHTSPNEGKQ